MKNKTWGGRFQQPLHPLAHHFNASLSFDHVLYNYDILGSKAHANMLAKIKIIEQEEANLLCKTLDEIGVAIQEPDFIFPTDCEDIHMFIEQELIKRIGEVGKKLHTGRSRNDQVALDLRLYTRETIQEVSTKLSKLIEVCKDFAQQYAQDSMPGYTHLQQAQPIFLGKYFEAYQHMFTRDLTRFQELLPRMNFSPLGAGALAGSSLPLDREYVAQALGFIGYIPNTLDAVSDRDFVIEFISFASLVMMHLSRLSEDLILWATSEFDFLFLSDAFATGSSLMPNKKNPDILELIRGKSSRVFGHLMGILTVMKGLPLAYNKDMQEDKEALFDTANTLIACLNILPCFLKSLRFNTTHMAEKANGGFLHATALVESLVLQGLTFRDAHHKVGAWVLEAIESGSSLSEVAQFYKGEKAIKPSHLLTGMELTTAHIVEILDLATAMKKNPTLYTHALQGKTLAILLEKPSFRTKLSFQVAIESLGGRAIESISNTRKKEEPKDSIRVLNEYCDIVMLRTHDDAHLQEMANYATIPIINGLSALYHPCQVLADLLSLQEHFGALSGLTLTYVGDGNNILHTLLLLAPKVGMTIHYCCPLEHQPNAALLSSAKEHFPQQIKSYTHPLEAVREAHAVYTDVWVSMGFEHHPAEAIFQGFQVNEELMSQARQDAVFMHCMPMERGKEVSGSLPDKPCSIIFSQSKNRLYVQQALLVFLLKTGGGGGRL